MAVERSIPAPLTKELVERLAERNQQPDELQEQLIWETRDITGGLQELLIAPEIGELLTALCRFAEVRRAVEIGTFTGYSALCIARGLTEEGRLITCDTRFDLAALAKRYWQTAGLTGKVRYRHGYAANVLRSLPATEHLDLSFVDADVPNYPDYYRELLGRTRRHGLIVVNDSVSKLRRKADHDDPWATAAKQFGEQIAQDDRVTAITLKIGGGLTVLQKT